MSQPHTEWLPAHTGWLQAPGMLNDLRWFIRRRCRFSMYYFVWSRIIGWPRAYAMTGPPGPYRAAWKDTP